jgi:hypothetical protein
VRLLIKPRCFLDEVRDRPLGYVQFCWTEMIAGKVETALDPANEPPAFVQCMSPQLAHFVSSPQRGGALLSEENPTLGCRGPNRRT